MPRHPRPAAVPLRRRLLGAGGFAVRTCAAAGGFTLVPLQSTTAALDGLVRQRGLVVPPARLRSAFHVQHQNGPRMTPSRFRVAA